MADLDITLKRRNGGAYDVLYPTTTWTQVESKPTTFTPTAHTHSGADITTGTVATARLGTGTPTSSNFLRGDGTWSTPVETFMGYQSNSDFANGTLVRTSINASVSTGDSFVIEITGKSYSTSMPPFSYIGQGYLYNGSIINFSGIDVGANLGAVKIFEDSGNLCFWWARIGYWNSFKVNVYRASGADSTPENTVTAITDSTEPTGTKKVTLNAYQVFSTYHIPLISEVSGLQTALDAKLPLAGGTLTGDLTLSSTYPRINLTDTNHNSDYSIINNDGSLGFWDNTNSAYRMHILSGGNVGIGTTTPSHRLHINNSNGILATFSGASSSVQIGADGNGGVIRPQTVDRLNFTQANGTNVMTINGSNVGVGTTSPSSLLEVISATSQDPTNTGILRFSTNTGSNDRGNKIGAVSGAGTAGYSYWQGIRPGVGSDGNISLNPLGGNVGIANTTPTEKLEVTGNVKATTFISTQATGTAPLTVASTTAVTNLNADLLDGNHASAFALSGHTHGNISNAGGWQSSPSTIGSGDSLVVTQSGLLRNTTLAFNSNTDAFLAQNGTWQKPIYTAYKSTQQSNATTTAATYHSITLPHSGYYSITVYGMWSKTSTTNLVGNVISVITSDNTGTPKFDGAFEWQQTTTASSFATENNSINIPTSGTSLGITTQTATQSRTETYWSMKGFLYTGTTSDKTLSFQFACSTAPGTGSVALEKIAIVATKVG